jgi:predicted TIM-barrel fold metal-dependent hydrolase
VTSDAGRIDVHFHSVPPAFRTAVETASSLKVPVRVPPWTPELSLDLMDRKGIQAVIGSISVPGVHFGDDATARVLARRCNEYSAELTARRPDRFGAFAVLPLPDIEGAVEEAAYALDVLKLDGVGLFTSYGNDHLGHARFDPVLQALHERGSVAFIHPTTHPACRELTMGLPPFLVEYPFDTTRAVINLILSGAVDRFGDIRFVLSHAGGALPYLSWRVASTAARLMTEKALLERYPVPLLVEHGDDFTAEHFMTRLRRFWFDTANAAGPQVLSALAHVADPSRVLFGSDWPYVPESLVDDTIEALAGSVPDASARAAIERGNALELFPRLT